MKKMTIQELIEKEGKWLGGKQPNNLILFFNPRPVGR